MFDPETFGAAMGAAIREAVAPLQKRIGELEEQITKPVDISAQIERAVATAVSALPTPKDGKDAAPLDPDALVRDVLREITAPSNGKDGADGRDGIDCDMDAVRGLISDAVKSLPAPKDGHDGKDGAPGTNGTSVTIDDVRPMLDKAVADVRADVAKVIDDAVKAIAVPQNGRDGINGTSVTIEDLRPMLNDAIKDVAQRAETLVSSAIADIPKPVDGKDGADGKNGLNGEKGADGTGLAGAMIDRDGALQVTFTNGEVKNLGPVVGKNGENGKDGLSLENFELEYLPESHEISLKAIAAGRVKELRYPAGGIRPAGYWREGTKAVAGEAWVHDGSLWIAIKSTPTKPATGMDDWIIAARKGRDGERGTKGADATPVSPIKLQG